MTNPSDGERAVRRAYIERALANYPDIDADRVKDVLHWFNKEASSLDVALLASNQAVAEAYRSFRADHIDPLDRSDMMRGIAIATAIAAIIALIVWRML